MIADDQQSAPETHEHEHQHAPDHVHNLDTQQKKTFHGMINTLPAPFAFWAGIISASAVLFAVGFIILAVLLIKGVDLGSPTQKTNTNTTATTTNANVNTAVANATTTVDKSTLRNNRGSGDITIVEYSDPECPYCKQFHDVMKQAIQKYDGKLAWSYKHLPIPQLHPKAPRESQALECAAEQGKFWEYTDLLFTTTTSNNRLPDEELFTLADTTKLDRSKFDDCLSTQKYKSLVDKDSAEGQSVGADGTPYAVIIDKNGKILSTIPGYVPLESADGISLTQILASYIQ